MPEYGDKNMEVKLRAWRREDAQDLVLMLNNRNVQNNLRDGIPFPYTLKDAEEYIRSMIEADPDRVYSFAVTCDDRPIGSIAAFRQSNIHCRTAEIGYYIAEPFWGKGVGSQAVARLCDLIFEQTDIIRLYAEPFAYNRGSCRVLEKNGFVQEGVLKDNAVKNGRVIDMNLYARVKAPID